MSDKPCSRAELIAKIDAAKELCAVTMRAMDSAKFSSQIEDDVLEWVKWDEEFNPILSSRLRAECERTSSRAKKAEEVYMAAVNALNVEKRRLTELISYFPPR